MVGWDSEERDNLTLGKSLLSGLFKFIYKMVLCVCVCIFK